MTIDQILSEFIDAWNAGQRPDVDDFLERAKPGDRDELADALADWLAIAPTPSYDESTLAELQADPVIVALREASTSRAGLLPELVPRYRARRGLAIGDLAARLAERFGLRGQEERTADYLERLESGRLDGTRISRRLLEGLAQALGAPLHALADAAALGGGPRPAGAAMFRADGDGSSFEPQLRALTAAAMTPAPSAPLDELDRLFVGGPDA